MISAELTIVPIGTCDTSISKYIAAAASALENKGINYKLTGMGTLIETNDPDKLFGAIKDAHESIFKEGAQRVETHVKIDDRRDTDKTMDEKVGSVEQKMGK
ncbi:MTH1187 family thiamine-binding protein [Methanobacterium sp.]|uniref:MTH1187 family thiamine-binding protein n=1 Tax=Methanobacterium sp. TaxID=2164 RepID=UPI003C74EE28